MNRFRNEERQFFDRKCLIKAPSAIFGGHQYYQCAAYRDVIGAFKADRIVCRRSPYACVRRSVFLAQRTMDPD